MHSSGLLYKLLSQDISTEVIGIILSTSNYQSLKMMIVRTLGISKDAAHIYVGFVTFIVAAIVKRSMRSFSILIPVFLLSVLAELPDLYDDFNSLGRFRLGASVHDIFNTNLIPLILIVLCRARLLIITEFPRERSPRWKLAGSRRWRGI